jgi:hypothetical protein
MLLRRSNSIKASSRVALTSLWTSSSLSIGFFLIRLLLLSFVYGWHLLYNRPSPRSPFRTIRRTTLFPLISGLFSPSICRPGLVVPTLMYLKVQSPARGVTLLLCSRRLYAPLQNVSAVVASCCLPGVFCTSILGPQSCSLDLCSHLSSSDRSGCGCGRLERARFRGGFDCALVRVLARSNIDQSEAVFVCTIMQAVSPNGRFLRFSHPPSSGMERTLAPDVHQIDL